MKPIVTIGMCMRNCENSIKEAIHSILGQDFPHELMEVIFVDDGSEDQTLSVVKDSISRINIQAKVFHSEWKGLGAARNKIVNNASGDFIIWIDGDMALPKDFVRKQVEFMEQNPKVGIAKARYGIALKENIVAFLENIADVAEDARAQDEWKGNLRLPGTGGSIYRVKAIKQVKGFDDDLRRVGEDQDAAYRIKDKGWLIYRTHIVFYEKRKLKTWKELWAKYYWHGYDHYDLYHKNRNLFILHTMVPPASFIAGLMYSIVAYRLTYRRAAFLLPFQYAFKMTAWLFGFLKNQISFRDA